MESFDIYELRHEQQCLHIQRLARGYLMLGAQLRLRDQVRAFTRGNHYNIRTGRRISFGLVVHSVWRQMRRPLN